MEQHPIPQQISSYEFKLVGEMTLKQFLKAAVGIVIALLINATKLIFFIKWPLILIFGGGGLLLAFVPFEDRPLETWIMSFIKSVYSPTIFTYRKKGDKNWLDIDLTKTITQTEDDEEEKIVVTKNIKNVNEFIESLPSVKKINLEESEEKLIPEEITPKEIKEEKIIEKPITTEAKIEPVLETKIPVKEEINWKDTSANLNLKTTKLEATGQTVFGSIPMPDKPEIPNLIVGMVTDQNDKIVEGAIIEIQDQLGNPSRVLKTNSLGQFRTSTQLVNGKYLIITEKENKHFDRVDIELRGQIVEPIKIKAID